MTEFNPYAPPKAEVADVPQAPPVTALWNPNAAANWSLLFSPAFGAWLHMLNWRALGEPEKAARSKGWVIGVLIYYIAIGLAGAFFDVGRGTQSFGLVILFVWYFSSGRAQARFVKERYGTAYPRRPWRKALLMAVGAYVAYLVALVVLGIAIGAATA